MKFKTINLIALILFYSTSVFAKIEATIEISPLKNNPNLISTIPTTDQSEIILSREQYVLSYNKHYRGPNWVAWKLDKSSLGTSGRSNNFQLDYDLESYFITHDSSYHAVDSTEYKGSCFDRGHQIPSADRTSTTANNETTFLMSNMSPQTAFLNRTIWENLESYTRDLVKNKNKKVYVIAGPIYDQDYGNIGPNKDIKVPSKAFKIVYILENDQNISDINQETPTIAVIMPNTLKDGSVPDFSNGCKTITANTLVDDSKSLMWEKYKTTVNEIESEAKIKIKPQTMQ